MEKTIVLVSLFAALIAVLGLAPKVPGPFGIPITAQSMGIMLCGTVLGAKRGALAVLLFITLTALGLPLLSGGRGGLGIFAGPSSGFIIGFPIAAYVAGLITTKLKMVKIFYSSLLGAIIGGIFVLYIPGIIGMSIALGKSISEATVLALIYLPGDLIKAFLCATLTQTLFKHRPADVLSRI
jgi:biotin transport system substrate-specific component